MIRRLPLLAGVLALSACCKHGPGTQTIVGVDGVPAASPNPLDFGTVDTGATKKLGLTLTNAGAGPLTVQSASLSGDSSFSVAPVPQQSLQPGGSFTVAVTCAPQQDGAHSGTLTFATDSSEKPSYAVPLTCTAFAYKIAVAPVELDFGDVQVGTTSAAQTFTITNDSTAPETIGIGPVSGSGDFQVSPIGPQASVPAGQSITVTVTYVPTITGAEQAQLPVTACAGGCPPVNVALTGTGVDTQIVLLDADTGNAFVSFGTVPGGQTVTAHVIAQANALPAGIASPLTATLTAPPSLQTGNDGFSVTPSDASFNPSASAWPASLTPGSQSTSVAYLVVTYTAPSSGAPANDAVQVPYTVGTVAKSPALLPLSAGEAGGACAQVTASPASVAFGTVLAGQTGSKVVTLTNGGTQICQLSNIGINPNDSFNEFGLQGSFGQVSLSPGQIQPFTVTFSPQSGTPPLLRKAVLSMQTSDPSTPTLGVPLSGTLQNAAYAPTAWPKWHHDNGNSGLTSADTSGNQGQVAWKVPIGRPVGDPKELATYIDSPAIGQDPNTKDDVVYMLGYGSYSIANVYAKTAPGAGQFVAVDGPSGNVLWSTQVTGPENSAQEATPTIVADGSIFLMSGGEQTAYPEFFHISPTGQVLWSGVQAVGGTTCACTFDPTGANTCTKQCPNFKINDGFDTCPGFDANGILYLFDDDQPGCDTFSSSTAQPTLQWSTTENKVPAHVESFSAALTSASESVFSYGGYVMSFDAKGNQLWGMATGNGQMKDGWSSGGGSSNCENDSKGSPAIDGSETDAVVAFGGFDNACSNIVGGIVGVNLQTGTQDWGFQFPSAPPPAAPYNTNGYGSALVAYSSPASLGNGSWVMGWLDGVYAFAPPSGGTGAATQLWKFPCGLVLSSPAVGGDGTVFVGSTDGNFYAIDGATGQLKWKYTVGAAVNSSPAIGSDGTVYFAADDGNLYALR